MSAKKILYSACGEFKVTAEVVEKFAKLVGDYNPVHLSDEAAAKTRFGRRIAHGMVAVSYAHSLFP
jgi:3-hydroxybutyryl-CoA dehydratase